MKVVAFERSVQGTGASRRLRNAGKTPAIIYGAGAEPKLIELDHNALYHALKKEAFHSSILDIEVAGKVEKALLRDFQLHPFKQLVLHVDFQRVSATEKIHVKVPLHFLNQETAPGVKLGHGIVNHILNDVEVSCLPADLPEFIEVDLGNLEIGQTLHISDLEAAEGRDHRDARWRRKPGRGQHQRAGWRSVRRCRRVGWRRRQARRLRCRTVAPHRRDRKESPPSLSRRAFSACAAVHPLTRKRLCLYGHRAHRSPASLRIA